MFRSLSEDNGGFVNEGLEISEESGKVKESFTFNGDPSTRIEITRSKYDQQKLHDEMLYKKPPSKSSELLFDFG
jgi:hypothetical protein